MRPACRRQGFGIYLSLIYFTFFVFFQTFEMPFAQLGEQDFAVVFLWTATAFLLHPNIFVIQIGIIAQTADQFKTVGHQL